MNYERTRENYEELSNLNTSPNIVTVLKSRMRRVQLVEYMGKIRKGYETWLENLVGRGNFGD
jgi:hypothetical protein